MPGTIDCPGRETFTQTYGVSREGTDPVSAFLKAFIVLAMAISL